MVPCTLIDTIPHTLGGYDWGYLATVRLNRSKVWSGVLISTLFIFHFSVALCFLTWALVTPALMSELTVKTVSNSPPWKLLVFARLSLIFKQLKKKFHFISRVPPLARHSAPTALEFITHKTHVVFWAWQLTCWRKSSRDAFVCYVCSFLSGVTVGDCKSWHSGSCWTESI